MAKIFDYENDDTVIPNAEYAYCVVYKKAQDYVLDPVERLFVRLKLWYHDA